MAEIAPIFEGVSKVDGSPLFAGYSCRECGEHRTVGSRRAWCFDDSEWCYSSGIDMACRGCEIASLRAQIEGSAKPDKDLTE